MIFEDLVGIFGYADFFRGELFVERVAEVVGCDFQLFDFGQRLLGGALELNAEGGVGRE